MFFVFWCLFFVCFIPLFDDTSSRRHVVVYYIFSRMISIFYKRFESCYYCTLFLFVDDIKTWCLFSKKMRLIINSRSGFGRFTFERERGERERERERERFQDLFFDFFFQQRLKSNNNNLYCG